MVLPRKNYGVGVPVGESAAHEQYPLSDSRQTRGSRPSMPNPVPSRASLAPSYKFPSSAAGPSDSGMPGSARIVPVLRDRCVAVGFWCVHCPDAVAWLRRRTSVEAHGSFVAHVASLRPFLLLRAACWPGQGLGCRLHRRQEPQGVSKSCLPGCSGLPLFQTPTRGLRRKTERLPPPESWLKSELGPFSVAAAGMLGF